MLIIRTLLRLDDKQLRELDVLRPVTKCVPVRRLSLLFGHRTE